MLRERRPGDLSFRSSGDSIARAAAAGVRGVLALVRCRSLPAEAGALGRGSALTLGGVTGGEGCRGMRALERVSRLPDMVRGCLPAPPACSSARGMAQAAMRLLRLGEGSALGGWGGGGRCRRGWCCGDTLGLRGGRRAEGERRGGSLGLWGSWARRTCASLSDGRRYPSCPVVESRSTLSRAAPMLCGHYPHKRPEHLDEKTYCPRDNGSGRAVLTITRN